MSSGSNCWIVEAWSHGVQTPEMNRSQPGACQDGEELQAEIILRTITQMLRCSGPDEALRLLANRLQQVLGCRQVALGLCAPQRRKCCIRGLSGVVRFDSHSRLVGAIQDALEETLVQESETQWPPREGSQHGALAHEKLVSVLGARRVASMPLRNEENRIVGVILLIDEPVAGALDLLHHYGVALATCLEALERDRRSFIARKLRQWHANLLTWRGRAVGLAAICLTLSLAVPWPYKISCQTQVQPVTRRFVVAPYDGTLDKAFVAPGDVVRAGDILARMDEREIRWELAGLEADYARAEKERDAAMAAHKTGSTQLAELEMKRLDVQITLLEHRIESLAIRSPIAGIVVAGDLEKAEGAPLTIGQTLFEVAPLKRMNVEVNVPEADVSYVSPGMPVAVSLDAFADDTISGQVTRVSPQAELKDHESVFVAEFEVDNPEGRLRPGMNGWADIVGPRKSLGWILFHKPWTSVRRALAW